MKRENGFYWVKYQGDWIIALWELSWREEYQWCICGNEQYLDDDEMEEVNENRILPPSE